VLLRPGRFQTPHSHRIALVLLLCSLALSAKARRNHLGKRALLAYSLEISFREVLLPDSQNPLVIPRSVTTTLDTDKGKLVIRSNYEPEREIASDCLKPASKKVFIRRSARSRACDVR
jgi:hypothetical protein